MHRHLQNYRCHSCISVQLSGFPRRRPQLCNLTPPATSIKWRVLAGPPRQFIEYSRTLFSVCFVRARFSQETNIYIQRCVAFGRVREKKKKRGEKKPSSFFFFYCGEEMICFLVGLTQRRTKHLANISHLTRKEQAAKQWADGIQGSWWESLLYKRGVLFGSDIMAMTSYLPLHKVNPLDFQQC